MTVTPIRQPTLTPTTFDTIKRWIDDPPDTSRVVTFSPAVAERLLALYNAHNRPPKPDRIARYAEDMTEDEWGLTGDTVKFSDAKLLRDGQNRLMACVRSGVPFTTHVVFGIEDRFFDRMDRGKPRGADDILAIMGYPQSKRLASGIRWAYLIDEYKTKDRSSLEPRVQAEMIKTRYPTLPELLPVACAIYDTTRQPISIVLGLLFWFNNADPQRCSDFTAAWAGGQWGAKYRAIKLMQDELTRLHQASSGRVHDTVRAALITIAWNFFYTGQRASKAAFSWTPSEDFPAVAGRRS